MTDRCGSAPTFQGSALRKSNQVFAWIERFFRSEKRAVAFLAVACAIGTIEYFALGANSYVNLEADGDSNIPARILFGHELREGLAGQWEPHFAGGMDRLTSLFQINLLSPLFAVLPAWLIIGGSLFLSAFVGSWAVYALLRTHLSVFPPLAILTGLFYAFGVHEGLLYFYAIFEVALMPLVLLALHAFKQRLAAAMFVQFLLGLVLGWGYGLHSFYLMILFVPWARFVANLPLRSVFLVVAAHLVGWLIYFVPIFVPLFSAVSASGVAAVSSKALSLTLTQVLGQLVTRGFYFLFVIYPIPLLPFALLALPLGLSGQERRNVLWIALTLALLLYFVPLISWLQHTLGLQLDSLRLRRMSNVVALSALYATAVGAHGLGERLALFIRDRERVVFRLGFRGIFCLVLGLWSLAALTSGKMYHAERYGYGANYRVLYENPLISSTFGQLKNGDPFRVVSVFPKPFHSLMQPDHAWAYDLETADGYFAFHSLEYTKYWESMYRLAPDPLPVPNDIEGFTQGRRFYVQGITKDCSPLELGRHVNLRFLSNLNVAYLISPCPLTDRGFELVSSSDPEKRRAWNDLGRTERLKAFLRGEYPGKELYIYRNRHALPRISLTGDIKLFSDAGALLDHLALSPETFHAARLIKNARTEMPSACPQGTGYARIVHSAPDALQIEADVQGCAMLIIRNNFHSGWTARVDGVAVPILRTNLLHQGIYLPQGRHHVTLSYTSPLLRQFGTGS
jgi:hypothetical protein